MADPLEPLQAALAGRYRIVRELGRGGMGIVYLARDSRLGRDVAIKVLPGHLSSDPRLRQRFEREARAISSLNHPHICVLYDIGRRSGIDYLVMEHLEGETLADRLQRGPLQAEEVMRYGAQIADALDKAHQSGVVHRDLKPSNIMLTKDGVKLMDFGLSRMDVSADKAAAELSQSPTMTTPLTSEGSIVGTLQYMSPEHLEGQAVDARSDIFSLGAVLYEMATGRRVFEGKNQASLIAAIMRDVPRSLIDLAPEMPSLLDRIVRRCLAKNPQERWQSARDVALELGISGAERDLGGVEHNAAAPTSRTQRHVGRALALVGGLVIVALAVWWWRSSLSGAPLDDATVLVLPFEVRGEESTFAGEAMAEAIAVELALAENLRVLPVPDAVDQVSDPIRRARMAGAGRVVSGWIRRDSSGVLAGVQLLDARTDRILWGASRDEQNIELSAMSSEIVRSIAKKLGANLGADYDYPLYPFGDADLVSSSEFAAVISAWRSGSSRSAIPFAEQLVARFPGEISARALQTFLLHQDRRDDDVRAAIDAMDRLDPDNPYGDVFRSFLLYRERRWQQSEALLDRVLKRQDLRPGLRAWLLRTRAQHRLGQASAPLDLPVAEPLALQSEIATLEEAIRIDPGTAWGYEYLGRALHNSGQPRLAVGYLLQAVALEPMFPITHSYLGAVLLSLGQWREGEQELGRACELGDGSACALQILALHRSGEMERARILAERVEQGDLPSRGSSVGWAKYHLARYWASAGNSGKALAMLRNVVADGFDDPRILRDEEFVPLRGNREFENLMEKVKKRVPEES